MAVFQLLFVILTFEFWVCFGWDFGGLTYLLLGLIANDSVAV